MKATAPTYGKDVGARPALENKLELFFSQFPLKSYEKNQIFLFPDDKIERVFYVVEGNIRVYDISTRGNEVVVNVFQPRSLFPISKTLNNTRNHYFYQASTVVKTREAAPESFVEFLRQNSDVALDILARIYLLAQEDRRRMAHLMGGSAAYRLIYELILQAYHYGRRLKGEAYLINMSEAEVGARSGLSRETVSREIRELKGRQLVTVNQDGLVIQNINALETILGSNL